MKHRLLLSLLLILFLNPVNQAWADSFADTVRIFQSANESRHFFDHAYGYAVFPSIGKGGLVVGGAYGEGRVYVQGEFAGITTMTQITVGLQMGGQAYRQIIFFEDERAFRDFTSDNFEFGAQASAVAITASAQAGAGTTGASAGASPGRENRQAQAATHYYRGMAIFTVARGGLMYEASVGGQKFSFTPK